MSITPTAETAVSSKGLHGGKTVLISNEIQILRFALSTADLKHFDRMLMATRCVAEFWLNSLFCRN